MSANPIVALSASGALLPGRRLIHLLSQRSVQFTILGWGGANALVLLVARGALPFDWPDRTVLGRLIGANAALLEVAFLMLVVYALTRSRKVPDLAARAPARAVARRETLLLLAYGVLGLMVGYALGRAFGWHPFGFHLAGTLYGTHDDVEPADALAWAGYNFIVYALVPLVYFRRRYSAEALNLRSSNRANDALVIIVVLVIESLAQASALGLQILDLSSRQLLLGLPLTFGLYFVGTVLPTMIFIYAILIPRYLKLTGSMVATVILGGLTYTLMHVWDAWTVFTSPGGAALSVVFLLLTYLGPGMMKTVLTLRTGNAWVHVWAYHALAPHTLLDTPLIVRVFQIR
jgi:hypothetical protein